VITDLEPVFSRLEHHKTHEYAGRRTALSATVSLGLGGGGTNMSSCQSPGDGRRGGASPWFISAFGVKRKRGRPPKFPRSPISSTSVEHMNTELSDDQEQDLASGYQKYKVCRLSRSYHDFCDTQVIES